MTSIPLIAIVGLLYAALFLVYYFFLKIYTTQHNTLQPRNTNWEVRLWAAGFFMLFAMLLDIIFLETLNGIPPFGIGNTIIAGILIAFNLIRFYWLQKYTELRSYPCKTCNGRGSLPVATYTKKYPWSISSDKVIIQQTCTDCNGVGYIKLNPNQTKNPNLMTDAMKETKTPDAHPPMR
ncbi:MAG: hypothetical protein IPI59_10855 [Sphingobacteriales bacterium]|jgi:hypothetical protein|nr:hypothetical protein [Sphingobacteriales bacterium]MBP9141015.1 hypothetical protein [Chitinophagales bacterium]MDA0197998.1 hypothetical protein [Bacteroidota bacterium]MBK6889467.1 hypothetical protein [Sphingobacteriales bacterium]MBK7528033.1 hypothetical protein [Sphingobacteriales bacterium]